MRTKSLKVPTIIWSWGFLLPLPFIVGGMPLFWWSLTTDLTAGEFVARNAYSVGPWFYLGFYWYFRLLSALFVLFGLFLLVFNYRRDKQRYLGEWTSQCGEV